MTHEYYGIASTPTDDFLAHYGIKGMKWGVRKAIASGNSRSLARQYRKAAKKLAKLEKRATSGKKYAKRAAALGAGAAAAGGLAALGTGGVASGIRGAGRLASGALTGLGNAAEKAGRGLLDSRRHGKLGGALMTAGRGLRTAGSSVSKAKSGASHAIDEWGRSNSIGRGIQNTAGRVAGNVGKGGKAAFNTASRDAARNATSGIAGMSNNTIARIGAGALGAGLAAGAGYNAYRAATTKRAARKAAQFRSEMNKAFKGTKYAGQTAVPKRRKKRG